MSLALKTIAAEKSGMRDTSRQDKPLAPKPYGWRGWSAAAVVLLVFLAWALPAAMRWSDGDIAVDRERLRIATVTLGPFVRDVAVQGVVVAAVRPTLFAPHAGNVTFLVQAGDKVRSKDALARIDSPELLSRLSQEQATLNSMEINLQRRGIENRKLALANEQQAELARLTMAAAERELRRAQRSWDERLVSEQDLEEARDDFESASVDARFTKRSAELSNESLAFELEAERQQRDRQQLLVADLKRQNAALNIRSPVDGMVGNLLAEQQAMVSANTPLLSVVDLSAFEVEARVSENYSDDLRIGMVAAIGANGEDYPAYIAAISPQVEQGMVTVRVRFRDITPEGLRQNQRLSGRIVLEQKQQALTLSRGGFLQSEGGRFAYLIDGDMAERVAIVVGSSSVSTVEILKGLDEGDQVIISNTELFKQANSVLLND